jgi:hypothetical protein
MNKKAQVTWTVEVISYAVFIIIFMIVIIIFSIKGSADVKNNVAIHDEFTQLEDDIFVLNYFRIPFDMERMDVSNEQVVDEGVFTLTNLVQEDRLVGDERFFDFNIIGTTKVNKPTNASVAIDKDYYFYDAKSYCDSKKESVLFVPVVSDRPDYAAVNVKYFCDSIAYMKEQRRN